MFHFHHVGIACEDIQNEADSLILLGYRAESEFFLDLEQGVQGQFLVGGGPRIELLQSAGHSTTLLPWLKRGIKMYHIGYLTDEFDTETEALVAKGAVMTREPLKSAYFDTRITFLMLRNMSVIELIEFNTRERRDWTRRVAPELEALIDR
jgi:methylmalonyl-CoA/ethylmalonyl-CoA epimerase